MTFSEFAKLYLIKDTDKFDDLEDVDMVDYIDNEIRKYRARLEKILKIIFDVDFIKYYSSKDGSDNYWFEQDICRVIEQNVASEKDVVKELKKKNKLLTNEKRLLEIEKLQKKIYSLERKKEKIHRKINKLENWETEKFESIMAIVYKDAFMSAMEHIEEKTAIFFLFY